MVVYGCSSSEKFQDKNHVGCPAESAIYRVVYTSSIDKIYIVSWLVSGLRRWMEMDWCIDVLRNMYWLGREFIYLKVE